MLHRASVNMIGWCGVIAILIAYALVSFRFIQPTHLLYQLLNITGAGAIAFETFKRKDAQPMVLNLIWMLIGLIALAQSWLSF